MIIKIPETAKDPFMWNITLTAVIVDMNSQTALYRLRISCASDCHIISEESMRAVVQGKGAFKLEVK